MDRFLVLLISENKNNCCPSSPLGQETQENLVISNQISTHVGTHTLTHPSNAEEKHQKLCPSFNLRVLVILKR